MYYIIFNDEGDLHLKQKPYSTYEAAVEYASKIAPSREAQIVQLKSQYRYDADNGGAVLDEGPPCHWCGVPENKPGGRYCPHCGGC